MLSFLEKKSALILSSLGKKNVRFGGIVLAIFIFIILSVYIFKGPVWYLSSNPMNISGLIKQSYVLDTFCKDFNVPIKAGVSRVIMKEKVTAIDAVKNLFALLISGVSTGIIFFLGGIYLICITIPVGLFTASWGTFLSGIIALIACLLSPIIIGLMLFLVWVFLFFQPSTPGFAITWLIFGLPVIVPGIASALSPHATFVIVFVPKSRFFF